MTQPTDGVTNLFVHGSAAKRYAAARPYFHPLVVARIVEFTKIDRFGSALDVACGTGQSARALADIADAVEAVDISAEMLKEAVPHDRVRYHRSPAERLPFADALFDLATVSMGFHWFDQATFLREASRVLKPAGWLVVYNSGFRGEMEESSDFRVWAHEVYPRRFPTPPRRSFGVTAERVSPHGFELCGEQTFAFDQRMNAEQLAGYLMTQTNVIAAVEAGTMPEAEAAEWIMKGVSPFFSGNHGTMKFTGSIWFLRRLDGKVDNRD